MTNSKLAVLEEFLSRAHYPYIPYVSRKDEFHNFTLDLNKDDAAAASALLVQGGDWDFIPGRGEYPEVWFHKSCLLDLGACDEFAHKPCGAAREFDFKRDDATKALAQEALELSERWQKTARWIELPDDVDRLSAVETAAHYHAPYIQSAMKHAKGVSFHTVVAVNAAIAHYYLENAGFTSMTHARIARAAYCSPAAVSRAMAVLSRSGLWGYANGSGWSDSRYYPLFTQRGREGFRELIIGQV